ncbi:MAG: DUF2975 domain-containing protein [Lachnospiraceae bacterium]|nr:DUF2975 domain-containing protein [Lachnospiraceae bacterium]
MNKENAIIRINKIGNAGSIIALICKILIIIGLVLSIIGGCIMLAMPNDLFSVSVAGQGTLDIHLTGEGIMDDFSTAVVGSESGNISFDGQDFEMGGIEVSEDGKTLSVPLSGEGYEVTPGRIAILIWMAAVYLVLTLIMIILIGRLFKALKVCKSPFEENVIKDMQRCAWGLIPWAVADSVFDSLADSVFSNSFNFRLGVNLNVVFAILIILGLAQVFKYGAMLQTESDETL